MQDFKPVSRHFPEFRKTTYISPNTFPQYNSIFQNKKRKGDVRIPAAGKDAARYSQAYQTKAYFSCSQKKLVHKGSNELLEEPLASKLLFLGAAMKKYKKPKFWKKKTFSPPYLLGEDLTQASTMQKSRLTAFKMCVIHGGPHDFWPDYCRPKSEDGRKY